VNLTVGQAMDVLPQAQEVGVMQGRF
jgi:hypothetical protein